MRWSLVMIPLIAVGILAYYRRTGDWFAASLMLAVTAVGLGYLVFEWIALARIETSPPQEFVGFVRQHLEARVRFLGLVSAALPLVFVVIEVLIRLSGHGAPLFPLWRIVVGWAVIGVTVYVLLRSRRRLQRERQLLD